MEINQLSSTSQPGVAAPRPIGGAASRSAQTPSRLLNQILIAFSDSISQGFHGYSTQAGYNILDQLQSIRKLNNYNNPLSSATTASAGTGSTTTTLAKKRGSFLDLSELNRLGADLYTGNASSATAGIADQQQRLSTLGSSYYYNKLPEFCFLNILREISEFYDNIDQLLTSSSPSETSSAASTSPETRKSHAYSDSLSSIRDLARDGEVLISQRIINRLLEIVLTQFSSFASIYPDGDSNFLNAGVSSSKMNKASIRTKKESYHPQRVETTSKDFKSLVLRAMRKIDSLVHRSAPLLLLVGPHHRRLVFL
jgi:hypothetical protein